MPVVIGPLLVVWSDSKLLPMSHVEAAPPVRFKAFAPLERTVRAPAAEGCMVEPILIPFTAPDVTVPEMLILPVC